jgi:YD repeat-containing protein
MKSHCLLLSFFICCSNCVYSQEKDTIFLNDYKLIGFITDGKMHGEWFGYNKDSNLPAYKFTFANGGMIQEYKYIKLIDDFKLTAYLTPSFNTYVEQRYDEFGNLIEMNTYNASPLV